MIPLCGLIVYVLKDQYDIFKHKQERTELIQDKEEVIDYAQKVDSIARYFHYEINVLKRQNDSLNIITNELGEKSAEITERMELTMYDSLYTLKDLDSIKKSLYGL